MAIKLTARQQQIFNLIEQTIHETGFPPTRAEIAHSLGFKSPNAAEDHIKALAKKGAIIVTPGASRGIRLNLDAYPHAQVQPSSLLPEGLAHQSLINDHRLLLPVIGRVAAGHPINAIEHHENTLLLDASLFSHTPDYLLKVKGDSMKNIGILDGDLLAVKKTSHVYNGQIVVARIEEDVTVKRFERLGNNITLYPENDDFSPITIGHDQHFEIEGLAVGLIRHNGLSAHKTS